MKKLLIGTALIAIFCIGVMVSGLLWPDLPPALEVENEALLKLSSESKGTLQTIDIRINGLVGLGTDRATVVRHLGKPLKEISRGMDDCAQTQALTLRYDGLEIYLLKDARNTTYEVSAFEATSPKWNVSDLRVGESDEKRSEMYGEPAPSVKTAHGFKTSYALPGEDSGFITVETRTGRVFRISAQWTLC